MPIMVGVMVVVDANANGSRQGPSKNVIASQRNCYMQVNHKLVFKCNKFFGAGHS